MTETSLYDSVAERDEPVPYRVAEGLRVTAQARGQRGPRQYVVRSRTGETCQLGDEEHFLLTMLDGKRSFADIEEEFHTRFDETLSPEHFQSFIDELRSVGIVLPADESPAPAAAPPPMAVVEDLPADPQGELAHEVVPADDRLPLYPRGLSLAPVFLVLARLGSPLRYFAWFLIPAPVLVGIALYGHSAQMSAALNGLGGTAALLSLAAAVAALVVPNLARGAIAAFHGLPREAFRPILAGYLLPWFKIDRGWVATMPRKAQAWIYGGPLLARLALFATGAALWRFAPDPAAPAALAALLVGGVGLWSFLLTATPLWPSDGRHWLSVYFRQPLFAASLWRALRGGRSAARDRGMLAAAAALSLAAIAGAALLWGGPSWSAIVVAAAALWQPLAGWLMPAADALSRWGEAGAAAVQAWAAPWLMPWIAQWITPWITPWTTAWITPWAAPAADAVAGGARFLAGQAAAASRSAAAVVEPAQLGVLLLGGAYGGGLLWLARAAAGADRLRLNADWDTAALHPGGGAGPGSLAPLGPGDLEQFAPSLDERLYAGGQEWPSNSKVLILAALIVAGLSVAFLSYPYESGGTFTILPYTNYEQDARVSGEVTEVLVREGQRVNEGQILGTLSDWSQVHNLAVAKAALDKANAQLQDLLLLPKPEQVTLARQQYEQAAARLPFSKAEYERQLALVQTGATSISTFEQTQSTYEQDKAAVAVLKANYDLVRVGSTAAEIEAARAAVRLAIAQVSYTEDQLARTRIRATTSGVVVTPNPQLMYGKSLNQGQTFVMLQDNRVAHVEVQVPETDIRAIHLGSRVRARAWGYEHKTWKGQVTLIADDATKTQTLGNVVRVIAEIPNSDGLLRPQMSGYAKVQTVPMPVWESYSRALVRFLLIEIWSWIP